MEGGGDPDTGSSNWAQTDAGRFVPREITGVVVRERAVRDGKNADLELVSDERNLLQGCLYIRMMKLNNRQAERNCL